MIRALACAAALLAGCTWFDAGPPDRTCRTDRDCFTAQDEVCDQLSLTCTLSVDGGGGLDAAATVAP